MYTAKSFKNTTIKRFKDSLTKPAIQFSRGKVVTHQSRHLPGTPPCLHWTSLCLCTPSTPPSRFRRSRCPSTLLPSFPSFSSLLFCASLLIFNLTTRWVVPPLEPAIGPSCHSRKPNWWLPVPVTKSSRFPAAGYQAVKQ